MKFFINVLIAAIFSLSMSQTAFSSTPKSAPIHYKLYKNHSLGKTTDVVFRNAIYQASKGDRAPFIKAFEVPDPLRFIHLVKKEVIAGLDKVPAVRDANFPNGVNDDTIVMMLTHSVLASVSYDSLERIWRLTPDNQDNSFLATNEFVALVFVYEFTDKASGKRMRMDLVIFECFNPKEVHIWEIPVVAQKTCPQCKDSVRTIIKFVEKGKIVYVDSSAGKNKKIDSTNYTKQQLADSSVKNNCQCNCCSQEYVYLNIWGQYVRYSVPNRVEDYYCFVVGSRPYVYAMNHGYQRMPFFRGSNHEYAYFERGYDVHEQQSLNIQHDPRNATYNPRNAVYNPRNATYNPRNAVYNPRNAAYNPRNAAYNPRNAVYNPRNAGNAPRPGGSAPRPGGGKVR